MKTKARRLTDAQADVLYWMTDSQERFTLVATGGGRWEIHSNQIGVWSYPLAATVRSLQDAGFLDGTTVTPAGLAALVREGFR